MNTTYAQLLQHLVYVRDRDYDDDADKAKVQKHTLFYVIQTILEKLRDEEDLAGIEGRAAFERACAEVDGRKRS